MTITIHELQDRYDYKPWEHETTGELIRKVMCFRDLEAFYNGAQMWDAGERSQNTALDYQRALSRRMVAMEQMYVEDPEKRFYARLHWLPEAKCFYAAVDSVENLEAA